MDGFSRGDVVTSRSCSLTAPGDNNSWWRLDLLQTVTVALVRISNWLGPGNKINTLQVLSTSTLSEYPTLLNFQILRIHALYGGEF